MLSWLETIASIADLYPEKNTMKEAVKAALDLYELVLGDLDPADVSYEAKRVNWKNAARKSLCCCSVWPLRK